jgi:hypothetical protein
VVERLHSKLETLSSDPRIAVVPTKKKKKSINMFTITLLITVKIKCLPVYKWLNIEKCAVIKNVTYENFK